MKKKTHAQLRTKEPSLGSRWSIDDDQQTRIEAELIASGRGDVVPREGLIGAHTTRRQPTAEIGDEEEASPMDEPIGGGADVAPTARAMERERERHRLQREIGVVAAGESGSPRQHREARSDRAALDEAAHRADELVK
jgi:hypothetical protein